jgi:hypothetical protein
MLGGCTKQRKAPARAAHELMRINARVHLTWSPNGSCSAARSGPPSSADCSRLYDSKPISKLLHLSKLGDERLEACVHNSTAIALANIGHYLPRNMI